MDRANPTPDAAPPGTRPADALLLGLAAAAILFLPGINLSRYWLDNPLYQHGLAIPFLAAFLAWRNLRFSRGETNAPESPFWPAAAALAGWALAAAPLRVIQIANPDWRLLDWALACSAILSLLALARLSGGPSLARALRLPALFLLAALPIPARLENGITAAGVDLVARASALLLDAAGVASAQSGRMLITPAGAVAVADDCGGVRSFLLAAVSSLFWAIFFRLGPAKTVLLFASGILCAALANIARITLLVFAALLFDAPALVGDTHDLAGQLAQLALVLAIPLLAAPLRPPPPAPGTPPPAIRPPRLLCLALPAAAALGAIAPPFWFAARESGLPASARPPLPSPGDPIAGSRREPLPAELRRNYRFTEATSLRWRDASGGDWSLYWLRFSAGDLSACTHNIHRPEVCLPMADFARAAEFPPLRPGDGSAGPLFQHAAYRRVDLRFHLFHATLFETSAPAATDWSYRGRLLAAWRGVRSRGADLVHLTVSGDGDPQAYRALAAGYLAELLGSDGERPQGRIRSPERAPGSPGAPSP